MKKLINCYDETISPENLWRAWLIYRRGKRGRLAVSEFEVELENNLLDLRNDLLGRKYYHGGYRTFLVHDPKRRVISAPSVRDHILHQAVYNILYGFYDRTFCFGSCSCRDGKGLYKAWDFARRYIRQFENNQCWVLHGDIKKCFDSISHNILKKIIRERLLCDGTLAVLDEIINSYEVNNVNGDSHGIPLGNLTSQLFINIYLDKLDKYAKDELRIKRYLRYADDFYIFCESKDECVNIANNIRNFLKNKLSLDFPLDHQQIENTFSGVTILGQTFFPEYIKISAKTYKRMTIKFEQKIENYENKNISQISLNSSWQSFKGVLDYGENYGYKKKMLYKICVLPFLSNMIKYN